MIRNPVTIEPLNDKDIESLQTVRVKPFQQTFSGQPADFLAKPEDGISVHLIKKKNQVVGMFRIDTRFHFNHTFAQANTPSIRNLVIDQNKQGQGMGTEACRMIPEYTRNLVPMARGLFMLVNTNNLGAYKSITRGGWSDTNEKYILGSLGQQRILWMPLQR